MTPAPKRRWSFSLRTLLAMVTVVALLLGGIAWAVRRGLLPVDVFIHDTYVIIDWQGIALLALLGVAGVALLARLLRR